MNINKGGILCSLKILPALVVVLSVACSTPEKMADVQSAGRPPRIRPDYSGITIPPNIAPLNFFIEEPGEGYFVRIRSRLGDPIRIQSRTGCIRIPAGPWRRLLGGNPGQPLIVDVFVKNASGQWSRFDSLSNRIAVEKIDGYLTYRRLGPLFNGWKKMGIYQRELETFKEKTVLVNRLTLNNCMNCHNFWQNGTDRWLLHIRGALGNSMLLSINGSVRKIDTKTGFNKAPAAYPAWHPSGDLVAFSISKLLLFFHATGENRDVLDRNSDIIVYDVPTNTVTTSPQISSPDRLEIWPAWSPDGKFLYFCSAPKIETFIDSTKAGGYGFAYDKIRYDLMRIAYDSVKRTWGKLETVLSSAELGLSITEPRVSPDGRFILFTTSSYSQFPIYLPSADLVLLDLMDGRWKKLPVNSDRAETFHSWSSDGRWIVFSSKRLDGLFARPYFSRIDTLGNASKPFVMPQKNPLFYESFLETYNVPEFTKEPIRVKPQELAHAAFSTRDALTAKLDPNVILSGNAGKAGSGTRIQNPKKGAR
jgi:hypothetical protein